MDLNIRQMLCGVFFSGRGDLTSLGMTQNKTTDLIYVSTLIYWNRYTVA